MKVKTQQHTLQCVVVFRYEKPVTPLCLCPKRKKKKEKKKTAQK